MISQDLGSTDDLYLMANVRPKDSGLPFTVYISEQQGPHDVWIKVASGSKVPQFVATVSVLPNVQVMEGELSSREITLVRQWIELNRDVIVGYWDRAIESTTDALAALKPIERS